MKFRKARVEEEPEINLIPMIDLFLVIIIFLMLTTTYSKFAELQINLPSADAEKPLDRPNEINVAISSTGQYQINRRNVSVKDVAGLASELRSAGGGLKEPVIVINADNNASHQSVIRVMDAARQAGFGQVAFAVEQSAK
jgi:biopolymer transport protein ExbD